MEAMTNMVVSSATQVFRQERASLAPGQAPPQAPAQALSTSATRAPERQHASRAETPVCEMPARREQSRLDDRAAGKRPQVDVTSPSKEEQRFAERRLAGISIREPGILTAERRARGDDTRTGLYEQTEDRALYYSPEHDEIPKQERAKRRRDHSPVYEPAPRRHEDRGYDTRAPTMYENLHYERATRQPEARDTTGERRENAHRIFREPRDRKDAGYPDQGPRERPYNPNLLNEIQQTINELAAREEVAGYARRESPFSIIIQRAPLPSGFRMPDIRPYEGRTDPQDHLLAFEDQMDLL